MKKMSQWPHLEVFGLQGLVGFAVVKDSQVSHSCRGVRTLKTAKKGHYHESEKLSHLPHQRIRNSHFYFQDSIRKTQTQGKKSYVKQRLAAGKTR